MSLSKRIAAALVAVVGWGLPAIAQTNADRLRETEQKQETLTAEARQLVGLLDAMLGEYLRNHLTGEDVTTVQRLRAAVDRLSTAEMRQVIDLLQQARAVQDPGASAKTVADAFSAQKQIVVSIQRILAEHARQQEARQLAKQINDLADRQARNLQNGIELGRLSAGLRPENFEAVLQAQLETQRGEQEAIAAELKIARERLEKFAAEPGNAIVAERFRAAARQVDQTRTAAEEAEAALRAGQLFKAVGVEKTNRDELRRIARGIAPRERGAAALREAEKQLTQIILEQEALMAETGEQKAHPDYARWINERMADIDPNRTLEGKYRRMSPEQRLQSAELRALFDAEQASKANRLARMEDVQGELAGATDHLGQEIPEVQSAMDYLKTAVGAMQEARSAMQEGEAGPAQTRQAQAIVGLRKAQEEIRKKAEEAELFAANSGDKVRDLERLRAAVEDLAKEERAMAQSAKPDALRQAEIARRANQMAQRSADLAPSAAGALQQAANHADQSRTALDQGQTTPGREQAGQAAQRLAQAAQQIAQELANAQQADEQRKRAEAALAELAKLIEAEQELDLNTARAMAGGKPAELQKLGPVQAAIEQKTTAFKASLAGEMIAAVQPLNDAENAMQQAREALLKPSGEEARANEATAIARLFDAQKVMGIAAQAAREALGQRFADAAAMAQAANRVQQALQDVAAAQNNLQQAAAQMGQEAAQTAAEAAREAAEAARQAAQAAQAAQAGAQQAGNQSAAQEAASAAQSAMQAAQQANQAAQTASALGNQSPQAAAQTAQQAAEQAENAMQSAMQAAQQAQQAQRSAQAAAAEQNNAAPANQASAQQATAARQAAQRAAQAAQRARQLARTAATAAESNAQEAGQSNAQASQQLADAAMQAAQAAAQQTGSPSMQQAAQQAARQLANAAAQAMNGQNAAAQQSAQQAAQQLAQASSAQQAAQAGIGQASAGQMPGQGSQGEMPGQGMQGAGRQPGQGKGGGPKTQSEVPSEGATGYQAGAPEAVQRAAREAAIKQSGFLGLPPRERAAIQQSLGEKYPQEFGPLVEQYLLNLANEPARK